MVTHDALKYSPENISLKSGTFRSFLLSNIKGVSWENTLQIVSQTCFFFVCLWLPICLSYVAHHASLCPTSSFCFLFNYWYLLCICIMIRAKASLNFLRFYIQQNWRSVQIWCLFGMFWVKQRKASRNTQVYRCPECNTNTHTAIVVDDFASGWSSPWRYSWLCSSTGYRILSSSRWELRDQNLWLPVEVITSVLWGIFDYFQHYMLYLCSRLFYKQSIIVIEKETVVQITYLRFLMSNERFLH